MIICDELLLKKTKYSSSSSSDFGDDSNSNFSFPTMTIKI